MNNLGAASCLEMGVVANSAVQYISQTCRLRIARSYVGTFMTSLDMHGFSLTLMELNERRKTFLDAPTQVGSVSPCVIPSLVHDMVIDAYNSSCSFMGSTRWGKAQLTGCKGLSSQPGAFASSSPIPSFGTGFFGCLQAPAWPGKPADCTLTLPLMPVPLAADTCSYRRPAQLTGFGHAAEAAISAAAEALIAAAPQLDAWDRRYTFALEADTWAVLKLRPSAHSFWDSGKLLVHSVGKKLARTPASHSQACEAKDVAVAIWGAPCTIVQALADEYKAGVGGR